MAMAPTPRFSRDESQPVVIQNKIPKPGEVDVSGNLPGGGGYGTSNATFRLMGNQSTPATTTQSPRYPSGYTSGIPQGFDTISGPGAQYAPPNSNQNGNNTDNPTDPGGGGETGTGKSGPDSWRNPNLSPSPTRGTSGLGQHYTAPANNPGTYDPNDIGRGIGWGYGYDPNTPSPGTTGKGPGGFTPRDGGGDMRTAATNYSMTSVGNSSGMPTYSSTARTGPADNRGGGGSPYLGPPGLGGGGQQPGGMTRPTDPSQFTPEQQARYGNMLGRIGYYHPGTGLSTAGTPYANPGYGNPAGIWGTGYQAPSWMGGGYRGGTGGGNGPNPGQDPPTRDPVMAGGGDYLRDIRNMDSGSGPTGGTNSGGGGGGGWVTVGMAPGMDSSRIASNDPRFAGRTGVPAFYPNSLQEIPQRGYRVGGQEQARGYTTGIPSGNDTISGPGAGSPYLGPPQGGPPPGGVPPYPTIDWRNPPSPEQLLQMVRDWWAQWQAANPGGGPGPNFPGMVPTGATGVQSVYPPGAWERMQEIWPWGRRHQPSMVGHPPLETDPYGGGGEYLKSQRPGSGPRR